MSTSFPTCPNCLIGEAETILVSCRLFSTAHVVQNLFICATDLSIAAAHL